jgi:hypothetical protein
LKIAGRVAFFTVFSDYQPSPPKLQHLPLETSVRIAAASLRKYASKSFSH